MPHAHTLPHRTAAGRCGPFGTDVPARHPTTLEGPKGVVRMRNTAQVLRIVGVVLTSVFAVFGILFAGGYAFEDPGGWRGVAIFASMAVPLAVLTWAARKHPDAALRWVLAGVVLVFAYAMAELFVDLVDAPMLPMAALVLSVPAAVLGLRNARRGGELLLLIAAGPVLSVLANVFGRRGEGPPLGAALGGSTGVVVIPLLVFAGIFLLASVIDPQRSSTEGEAAQSPTRPAAGAAR